MVNNLPAKEGDMGSIPGLRRFHMPRRNKARVPQLLSPHSRAHKLQLLKAAYLEPVLGNKRSHHVEEPAHWLSATRESLHAATKTQHDQK